MKHAEIIALAKEEGLSFIPEANSPLARIVRKAVGREREACAQTCEGMHEEDRPSDYAYAIRSRGQKEGAC